MCDFGISQIITSPDDRLTQTCGTLAYVAPEILSYKPYSGFKSDIWSLGIILFALCCGRLPFKGNSFKELRESIISSDYTLPKHVQTSSYADYLDLVSKLLVNDPARRLTIPAILAHPWMAGNNEKAQMITAIS